MLNVKKLEPTIVKFSNLSPTDTFEFDGGLFMKVSAERKDNGTLLNALWIDTYSGKLCNFSEHSVVSPVKLEILT